ncbi:MAG TPA: tRNA uridine-5-carboxymethylaminomethyl(34) synthesis enzyme MnmG, partial [Flavisolibacter sp.]
ELIINNGTVEGVVTGLGHRIKAKTVVLTNGTFLNGVIHIGEKRLGGGRVAERAAEGLTEQLVALGFESDRLKTGTPPRVDGRSLDYSKMEEQKGDEEVTGFSYLDQKAVTEQRSCWITYTTPEVHELLKTGFDRSPMYTGKIEGVGPRYCPSIEDKISRFAERERHQLFVEPEGKDTVEIYVNGFSTSLPEEVQHAALSKVPGFEKVKFFRPGYAIEYDYFPPTQLSYSLETKRIQNLFFAGQINGTTGYEEAACQGLMAGINAHLKCAGKQALVLKRSEAYIGVLIDDLISKGTQEPYRMFTSRAEFRTLLRQDNADLRLTEIGYDIGLASQERMDRVVQKRKDVEAIKLVLKTTFLEPGEINPYFAHMGGAEIGEKQRLERIILRPNTSLRQIREKVARVDQVLSSFGQEALEQAEIQVKYEVYINKEKELVDRMSLMEGLAIPAHFDYFKINALGVEAKEKLTKIKPQTLGQASRISGINPSDVQILMVYMGR